MSKKAKMKAWRAAFREGVFRRDQHKCVVCGSPAKDAHHITDRDEIPNGGYVLSNGISLCNPCHELAEQHHSTGKAAPGFHPDQLYARIKSSRAIAFQHAEDLADI